MLGNEKLEPTKKEEEMKKIARRSIVALDDIDENEIFDRKRYAEYWPVDFEKFFSGSIAPVVR